MSLLSALFGSSKPKKEQRSASVTSLPQAGTQAKPEQDFVVLQNSDFTSPQQTPYPHLGGLQISQQRGPGAGGPLPASVSSGGIGGHMDTLPRQALDSVPFKLDSKLQTDRSGGDQAWTKLTRSLNDIGARIEEYAYDFKLEHAVLNARVD